MLATAYLLGSPAAGRPPESCLNIEKRTHQSQPYRAVATSPHPLTVLCIACYFKGSEFMRACKRQGCRVFLLTAEKLSGEAWPRESLDDVFYFPGDGENWKREDVIKAVSYLARTESIDRIVPLDDFDLEKAAYLREHLRVPGLGDTRTRYFRDKLAMRTQARDAGIPVPAFVHVLNYDRIRAFTASVPAPWVLKPRSQASATGIKKIHSEEQLWQVIEGLGDEQSFYLLEQFLPGTVFHVDCVVFDDAVRFARVHRYADTPMQVAHEGGVFCTYNVPYGTPEEAALLEMNRTVMRAMGLPRGVSHTEFIQAEADGRFYFLETSARVGGAHIAEMLEASSGINLWTEWARIETLPDGEGYTSPTPRSDYSGILISLARQEHPDLSGFTDPEVVWRMDKRHHAGLIVRSPDFERVQQLLAQYTQRFYADFFTSQPLPDRPSA
jgi:biotin carboxylase